MADSGSEKANTTADLQMNLTEPTNHPGLESLAASIAMASGLIRDADDWPAGVKQAGLRHGCRELALRYMRVLASADPGPGGLDPSRGNLYGVGS